MTKIASVLLTLVGLSTYQRADFKDAAGLPVSIFKNETIRVTEEVADQLTGEDAYNVDLDDNRTPWFAVADDGTTAAYDFTGEAPVPGEQTIKHDLGSLPEERLLTDVVTSNGTLARKTPVSSPRAQRPARNTAA